jgi:hypothetical protein
VVQKDLLQRRFPTRQCHDWTLGELGEQRTDAACHLQSEGIGAGARDVDAGERRQLGRSAVEGDLEGLGAQVAQLGERSLLDQAARTKDADAIAQRLHLAQDVRAEKDRLTALLGLANGLAEGDLHQRVEPARRLVEDQQVGAARERGDELHLLPIALRERTDLLLRVQLEALDQHVAVGRVGPAADPREELERLGTRQPGPQVRLAGDVREVSMRLDRVAPRVDAEQLGAP